MIREWLLRPIFKEIAMKQAELIQQLQTLQAQVEKVRTEVTERVEALEQAVRDAQDGDLSPEVEEALNAVKTAVQGVDDMHPDTIVEQVQDQGVQR